MDIETRAFKYQNSINRGGKGEHVILKDPPAEMRQRSKKDTKKWCKGVVGREHKTVWIYTELTWGHNQGKPFVEPTIEFLREHAKSWQQCGISARQMCSTCRKYIRYGDIYKLRFQGITILTSLPAQE